MSHEKLKELVQLTPEKLWELYPERTKFEEKIIVEIDKTTTQPELVLEQFIKYLQIPKRKPWIVDKLCKDLRKELGIAEVIVASVLEVDKEVNTEANG